MSEVDALGLQWLERARDDLRSAEAHHSNASLSAATTCWLAQQAAEKAIKAQLVRAQVEFPFTHDLAVLSRLLAEPLAAADLDELVGLAKVAADSRYPGDSPEPSRVDAESAVAVARAVVTEVSGRFGGDAG